MTIWVVSVLTYIALASSSVWAQISDSQAAAILTPVAPRVLAELREYAEQIVETCPPSKCILVSLGPNNSLLDSFLRYHIVQQKWPESYLRYAPVTDLKMIRHALASDEAKERFIASLLPSEDEMRGKTVMFMRTLDAGMTVTEYFFPAVEEFLKSRASNWRVGAFLRPGPGSDYEPHNFLLSRTKTRWKEWDIRFKDMSRYANDPPSLRSRYLSDRNFDLDYYRYKVERLDQHKIEKGLKFAANPSYRKLDSAVSRFIISSQEECSRRVLTTDSATPGSQSYLDPNPSF